MKPRHRGIAPNIDFHFFIASTPVKSVQTLPIISNPRSVKNTDDLSHENPKVFGVCWYYIACSPEKGMVPGVERLPCIGV